MNQSERREYLIGALMKENRRYQRMQIPSIINEQKQLLRALMNVRFASPITEEFAAVQDEYLQDANAEKGFVTLSDMEELQPDLFLWQGDITRLKVGAIVNAANSGMTGCYQPCHNCIDNCIHTYAGIQLRNFCAELMEKQGHEEPTGQAKITPGFNLPCDYVIHTVGPRYGIDEPSLLEDCYRNCMNLAGENQISSIAFPAISTGVYHYPKEKAAEIAAKTVSQWLMEHPENRITVYFTYTDAENYQLMEKILASF